MKNSRSSSVGRGLFLYTVNRRAGRIRVNPVLFHQLFNMPIAQGVDEIPAYTYQNDLLRKMGSFETDHRSPRNPITHVQGVRLNHTIFAREERAARVGNGTSL